MIKMGDFVLPMQKSEGVLSGRDLSEGGFVRRGFCPTFTSVVALDRDNG